MKFQENIYDFCQIKNMFYMSDSESIYSTLVELGKLIHPINTKYKTDQNKVNGCQSNVWIATDNNTVYIDSDSIIVKGLLYVVVSIISSSNYNFYTGLEKYILNQIESIKLMDYISTFRKTGLAASIHKLCDLIRKEDNENS